MSQLSWTKSLRVEGLTNLLSPEWRSGGVGILQCVQIASKYAGAFEIHDRIVGSPEMVAKFRLWLPKAHV